MQSFLDKAGLQYFWDKIKSYIDSKIGGGSSGSSGGIIQWEDINGRPDLSKVSSMNAYPVVLQKDLWSEQNEQVVTSVPGILADEAQQLIIPVPRQEDRDKYDKAGIDRIDQSAGAITFHATTVPEDDLHIIVYVFGAAEVGQEFVGEWVWWSPEMTSNVTPEPYSIADSDGNDNSFYIFKGETYSVGYGEGSKVTFDFGSGTYVSGISFFATPSRYDATSSFPKIFHIEASMDRKNNYNVIFESTGNEYDSIQADSQYEFTFKPVFYRYYRIVLTRNWSNISTNTTSYLSNVKFLKLEDAQ